MVYTTGWDHLMNYAGEIPLTPRFPPPVLCDNKHKEPTDQELQTSSAFTRETSDETKRHFRCKNRLHGSRETNATKADPLGIWNIRCASKHPPGVHPLGTVIQYQSRTY
jgi:hypothetical protein